MYIMRNNNEREFNMLVSKWKENFKGTGVWTATNCISKWGNPKIVVNAGDNETSHVFGPLGDILNCGDAFETFEEAAKFLESTFTFTVTIGNFGEFDVV